MPSIWLPALATIRQPRSRAYSIASLRTTVGASRPPETLMTRAPFTAAKTMPWASVRSLEPSPNARTARIGLRHATPAMQRPLLPIAAAMPAMRVPCPSGSPGSSSPSSTSDPGSTITLLPPDASWKSGCVASTPVSTIAMTTSPVATVHASVARIAATPICVGHSGSFGTSSVVVIGKSGSTMSTSTTVFICAITACTPAKVPSPGNDT